jgi:hypothetical protein
MGRTDDQLIVERPRRFNDATNHGSTFSVRFLAGPFAARGNLVFAGLPFVVTFADLLLDFFGNLVDGRVQITFDVFGKKIGSAHAEANGAAKLFSGGTGVVVFEGHPRINGALVKMIEFLQLSQNVVLNGLGQGDIVRRQNQFHDSKMQFPDGEIQFFLEFKVVGYFRASVDFTAEIVLFKLGSYV